MLAKIWDQLTVTWVIHPREKNISHMTKTSELQNQSTMDQKWISCQRPKRHLALTTKVGQPKVLDKPWRRVKKTRSRPSLLEAAQERTMTSVIPNFKFLWSKSFFKFLEAEQFWNWNSADPKKELTIVYVLCGSVTRISRGIIHFAAAQVTQLFTKKLMATALIANNSISWMIDLQISPRITEHWLEYFISSAQLWSCHFFRLDISFLLFVTFTQCTCVPLARMEETNPLPESFPPACFRLNARPPAGHLYYFSYGLNMNPNR